jgi:hypothetical protein
MKANSQTLFTRQLCASILVTCFLCWSSKLFAQDDHTVSPHIRGGLILGMNASQIDGDDYAGYHKVGFNAGFYGQLPLSKLFFFSTEILYAEKGGKSPVVHGLPTAYSWTLQYAEIPILFHYQDKRAFNVGAGLSYSRLVGEQLYADQEPQPPIDICPGPPADVSLLPDNYLCIKKSDFTVMAEANYLATKHLVINVRFAYSLAPIGYFGGSNYINRGMYNNLLSFRLMWVFGT